MSPCEERYRILISGMLDGELDSEQQADLDNHLRTCVGCQREVDGMRRLFSGTAEAFGCETLPQEIWDTFLQDVYNRMERKTGWMLLIAGVVCLTVFGTYSFIADPWGSALVKTLVATPIIGLTVLFISVLRQRLANIKTDRYTKEVHR